MFFKNTKRINQLQKERDTLKALIADNDYKLKRLIKQNEDLRAANSLSGKCYCDCVACQYCYDGL